jgi:hypothetical protein
VFCDAQLEMSPDCGGIPPGTLDQRTPGMASAGFGHSALPAPWPTGGFQWSQTSRVHEVSRVVAAWEVTECGHKHLHEPGTGREWFRLPPW